MTDEDTEDLKDRLKFKKPGKKGGRVLRKDHTHGGVLFKKGTKLSDMDVDLGSLDVMKDRGII